jgi:bifunctional UDP-N-acetylglucosamine pyrophosphorylase/glucosamine-1-phosphate N-acetyltransferase
MGVKWCASASMPSTWPGRGRTRSSGTGHAVQQALPHLDDEHVALVLYGDVPLIGVPTLRRLVAAAGDARLALLTVEMDNPTGYGRILRDGAGKVVRIVEEKDASDDERKVREVNTGILVAPVRHLRAWLGRIGNDNAQGEYYLTDIIAWPWPTASRSTTVQPDAFAETLGVNNKMQLAELERIHQGNIARRLMEEGVTVIDPARIDVRGTLTVGRDVEIDVNCVFEGEVELGDGVRIGANCVVRDARIGAGTRLEPFSHVDSTTMGQACVIGPYARTRPGTVLGNDVHLGNFVESQEQRHRRPLQGQPPRLRGRRRRRQQGQHRRRHHHLQLRRRQQAPHHHRGRGLHRLRHPARRAGARGPRRHPGRRHHAHQGRPRRTAHRVARKQISLEHWKRPVKQPR